MIRWLITLAVALLALPVAAQDLVTPSDRVQTHVNIRSAPSGDAAEIGHLEIGEGLPLVQSVPRWYEVQLPEGTGFVSKAWTTISQALAPRQLDELRIHFLNIGTGSCAIVECPGSNAPPLIVDCGSTGASEEDLDASETRAYIRNILSQHSEAPNVVLSHGDEDHYDHIPGVLDDVTVASVWLGGSPEEYTEGGFPAWLAMQDEETIRQNFPAHWHNDREPLGDDLSCGDASTYVLTVNTGTAKNARSLMVMIEHHAFTVVFTGDAEGSTEARALQNFNGSLKATVMTSSHHGADTEGSNSPKWATATAPEILVSSAGNHLGFEHPRCAATDRFTSLAETREHDVRCGTGNGYINSRTRRAHYVTEVNGAVIVTSNGSSPATVSCTRSVECGVKIGH
jgi:competence protein ComEC